MTIEKSIISGKHKNSARAPSSNSEKSISINLALYC